MFSRLAQITPQMVLAVVAPRDEVFGMSRMWEVYAGRIGWNTAVFRSRDQAKAWLRETVGSLE